ncbi:hypothetical protein NUH88_18850 [Nisaea acidiphila]|uniref:Uncharacterized protein n=1 Tax=Nisaea acidiphila TaxID=1862145 RepID=A0A9J7AQE5_9PROT|nr:hypothetical protein [Nisaea acidiphila]UUX49447.1 hypothetical protein NUH88_18850 [Nisaea acidiphila]
MADIDFRTWPAQESTGTHSRQDWMTPAGGFNRGNETAGAANQNVGAPEFSLLDQLPEVIVDAVGEWAMHLQGQSWRLRRRALNRFSEAFADQFLALNPSLSDEEYDSLTDIGYTCLLELLDDGQPISDLDQAHSYKRSVHDAHRDSAEIFLAMNAPTTTTVH